jgi:hypothetical protein
MAVKQDNFIKIAGIIILCISFFGAGYKINYQETRKDSDNLYTSKELYESERKNLNISLIEISDDIKELNKKYEKLSEEIQRNKIEQIKITTKLNNFDFNLKNLATNLEIYFKERDE